MEKKLYNIILLLIGIGFIFALFGIANDAYFELSGIFTGIGDAGVLILFGVIAIIIYYMKKKNK